MLSDLVERQKTVTPNLKNRGLPTSFYVGNSRLGDFSVPSKMYDFKVPTPEPDLSSLREPASVNFNLARWLFVPKLNWELARKLFVGRF